jgi:hypothetical protein
LGDSTGISLGYVSAGVTTETIDYVQATNTWSFGGGTGVVSPTAPKSIVLENVGATAFVVLDFAVGYAAPTVDGTYTITLSTADYNLGFFSWDNGKYTPFSFGVGKTIDFGIPVITKWETIKPTMDLDEFSGGKFLDVVGAGGGSNKYVVYEHTISALNTLSPLPSTATSVQQITLEVNGLDLVYGAGRDFTVAGSGVTLIPANIGYNIESTDVVVSKYFRV